LVKTDRLNCETETAKRTLQTGYLLYQLTDKNELSGGRYFNVNSAELIVRNALNEFKKLLQQDQSNTNNGFICTLIILIY